MKLSSILYFFIAGAAAAADGSVAAEQAGSLRNLKGGKPETTPYKVPPAHGLYKDPNLKPTNPNKQTKPTIDWRCKDQDDGENPLSVWCPLASAGKDGEDTCQVCCDCDCDSSADVPGPPTAEEVCEKLRDGSTGVDLACEGVKPENGSCDVACATFCS